MGQECGISREKAESLAARLRLSPAETELFVCSAEAAHARDPYSRERAQKRLDELLADTFSPVNMEKFNLIRDWYHYAILELTEVAQFESSIPWIARALNLSEEVTKKAVERLESLGFIDRATTPWKQILKDLETPAEISSPAIRHYHRQLMSVTENRIEVVPRERRELGSVVFALDQDLIPEMKLLVQKFQREAAAVAERSQKKDSVYSFNLQLIPLYEGDPNDSQIS